MTRPSLERKLFLAFGTLVLMGLVVASTGCAARGATMSLVYTLPDREVYEYSQNCPKDNQCFIVRGVTDNAADQLVRDYLKCDERPCVQERGGVLVFVERPEID